jgi:acetoin utilization protein AcuB
VSKTVGEVMSKSPITIESELSLADAKDRMEEHGIRHLPVVEGDALVGLLSDRDIAVVSGLIGVKLEKVSIKEAMQGPAYAQLTDAPYTCSPSDTLKHVTSEMMGHKYGSALVMEDGKLVGVYTTIDAMRAFVDHLD